MREGHAPHRDALVFCDADGGPLRKSNVIRRSFHPLLRRAGLPHIRFHDLRHTHATLLLSQGVHPKVVAERLGHASIAMTLDIYSHVLPSMGKEAAQRLDVLLTSLPVDAPAEAGRVRL
jgi:integrase